MTVPNGTAIKLLTCAVDKGVSDAYSEFVCKFWKCLIALQYDHLHLYFAG